jgi:toxin YhaV
MFVTIPTDPTQPEYRQGNTLGDDYKHWFRAKFGGQRFRLFFRFDTKAKVIIYAWVNDEDTKRPTARFEKAKPAPKAVPKKKSA